MASQTPSQSNTQRTRFVCISDTHGRHIKLPKGDVLIHAGDMTNMGGYSELKATLEWLEKADFECKIIVAGNHDASLDPTTTASFYGTRQQFHTIEECRELLSRCKTLTYLAHESQTIKLSAPNGPHTYFKIFGSPLSPVIADWPFMYQRGDGERIWDAIPLDTDVLVTHGPPFGIVDGARENKNAGCMALLHALWRVRPRLHVCGHRHEARGVARVVWRLDSTERPHDIQEIVPCLDPSPEGGRLCLYDFSSRAGKQRLNNDGAAGGAAQAPTPGTAQSKWMGEAAVVPGTRGLGGDPTSLKADQSALAGRMGRLETCVVNAAIQKHHERGVNKPIVVDLDLPIWE